MSVQRPKVFLDVSSEQYSVMPVKNKKVADSFMVISGVFADGYEQEANSDLYIGEVDTDPYQQE